MSRGLGDVYKRQDIKGAKKVIITSDVVDGKSDALIYGKYNRKIA